MLPANAPNVITDMFLKKEPVLPLMTNVRLGVTVLVTALLAMMDGRLPLVAAHQADPVHLLILTASRLRMESVQSVRLDGFWKIRCVLPSANNAKTGTMTTGNAPHASMVGHSTQANVKSQVDQTQALTLTAIKATQTENAPNAISDGLLKMEHVRLWATNARLGVMLLEIAQVAMMAGHFRLANAQLE